MLGCEAIVRDEGRAPAASGDVANQIAETGRRSPSEPAAVKMDQCGLAMRVARNAPDAGHAANDLVMEGYPVGGGHALAERVEHGAGIDPAQHPLATRNLLTKRDHSLPVIGRKVMPMQPGGAVDERERRHCRLRVKRRNIIVTDSNVIYWGQLPCAVASAIGGYDRTGIQPSPPRPPPCSGSHRARTGLGRCPEPSR